MMKICIIDDDEIYQFTSKINLKKINSSIEIIKFLNGEDAIHFFKNNANINELLPNIILLDINMPILNGWDFLAEYDEIAPSINKRIDIYVVSSSVDDIDYKKAKSIKKVADYLSKPIQLETFVALIDHYNIENTLNNQ
ncbi:MAG: response regulator [Chitinophagaceae bacterium]